MSQFLILVTSPHFETNSAKTTYSFCEAALQAGHNLVGIFFYGAGVSHANKFNVPLPEEPSSQNLWHSLAQEHQVDLLVCATAASRRGIMEDNEAMLNKFETGSLDPNFKMSGLVELAALSSQATRVVQF